MRIVQFLKNKSEETDLKKSYLGLQLPTKSNQEIDSGDIVELPLSFLGLSADSTSIDLIVKWDSVKETLQRFVQF